jgi:hypothetical protein
VTAATEASVATQIEALSASVLGIDGSRRVGWAKAFAAIRQLENASQDLNVARDDLVMYRERVSYLWGYITAVLEDLRRPGHYALLDLRQQTQIEMSRAGDTAFLDLAHVRAGRDAALSLMERLLDEDGRFKDAEAMLAEKAKQRLKRRRREDSERWKAEKKELDRRIADRVDGLAEKRVWYRLLDECGFETPGQLKRALGAYRFGKYEKRLMDEMTQQAEAELMKSYGIGSREELHDILSTWRRDDSPGSGEASR